MTAPLTPQNCDLRDFRFMPLEVERLMRSKAWLYARRKPEVGFYMMNLWARSWHEVPAASLEDDDDVLADAAMCQPDEWPNVKDAALRGWVKCEDGRLYHPVVAEKALEAWSSKVAQRARTANATAARKRKIEPNDKRNGQRDDDRNERRDDDVTFTKGQGERQVREQSKPSAAVPLVPRERMLALCEALGVSPATNTRILRDFPEQLNTLLGEGLDFERHILPAAHEARKRKTSVQSLNYLRVRAEELRSAETPFPEPFEPTDAEGWRRRLQVAHKIAEENSAPFAKCWSSKWGPPPGAAGCKVPVDVAGDFLSAAGERHVEKT